MKAGERIEWSLEFYGMGGHFRKQFVNVVSADSFELCEEYDSGTRAMVVTSREVRTPGTWNQFRWELTQRPTDWVAPEYRMDGGQATEEEKRRDTRAALWSCLTGW